MIDTTEDQIARVTQQLRPETPWQGRVGDPATLDERMRFYHTPGVSVAVASGGQIVWARGFGVTGAGGAPVTPDTLFQAASISKPVFAVAVLRLVAQGILDLDADVNTYLRRWRVPANDGWQPRVTLRQLLSHRAGLSVHGFLGYRHDEPLPSLVQALDGAPPANSGPVRVNLLPGTQLRYSGGGTTVAQLVVEDVLGRPLAEVMRELVLDPLGMRASTYEQPLPKARRAAAATGHPFKGQPIPGGWHTYPEQAAAGLWTTPADLLRLAIAVQAAARGEREDWLPAHLARELITPEVGQPIGVGFFIDGVGAARRFGHTGWNEGFMSELVAYAEHGLAAAVMVNSNEGGPLIGEILRAVGREYAWPGYPETPQQPVAVPPEALGRLAGVYSSDAGLTLTVAQVAGDLTLTLAGQPPMVLVPQTATAFALAVVNATVTFEAGADGAVTGLSLQQGEQRITAARQAPAEGVAP